MPLKFPVPTDCQVQPAKQSKSSLSQNVTAFRACYQRFEDCLEFAHSRCSSSLMETASNFVLDFDIIAKRAMGAESTRYRLFRVHFVQGKQREACCAELGVTQWTFAAEVRAIEQCLGEAFTNAGLFPTAPYFSNFSLPQDRIAA